MAGADDLTAEALEALLGERPLQSHPVLLSTVSTAIQWAGDGAPDGAVVVADHQIAPRGRAGQPWKIVPGRGLGFALVMRPQLEAKREGFLYTLVLAALADVCGPGVTIQWPDEVRRGDELAAAVGIEIRLGSRGVRWAVANFLLPGAAPPRGALMRDVLDAIDERIAAPGEEVLEEHRRLCATLGRHVRARLLGGASRLSGVAVDTLGDGSLVLELDGEADDEGAGRRVPVRPQDVSSIDLD